MPAWEYQPGKLTLRSQDPAPQHAGARGVIDPFGAPGGGDPDRKGFGALLIRPKGGRRTARFVGLSFAITVVATLPAFLIGALSVSLRMDLGISLSAIGLAIAVNRGSGALMAGALGRLADRLGPSTSMRLAAAIAAGCALGILVAADRWVVVYGVVAVGGGASPLAQASANLTLRRTVRDNRQGLAFGLKQSALPISGALAGIAVPLVALTIGWRWCFVFAAALALLVGLAVPSTGGGPSSSTEVPTAQRGAVDRTLLLVLALGLFLGATPTSALSAFTVESGVTVGFSEGTAALILTAGSLIAIAVRLGLGFYADRHRTGHLRIIVAMVAVSALGHLALSLGEVWSFLLGGIIAFAFGWGYAGLFWFVVTRISGVSPGRATGLVLPGGMVGAMLGPVLFGFIVDEVGHGGAWFVMAILSAASAAMLGFAWHLSGRTPAGQGPPGLPLDAPGVI